jgi:hypothetical protein
VRGKKNKDRPSKVAFAAETLLKERKKDRLKKRQNEKKKKRKTQQSCIRGRDSAES